MNKAGLFIIIFILTFLPCGAKQKLDTGKNPTASPVIFIYHIPDEQEQTVQVQTPDIETKHLQNIVSDDVTADTSGSIEENNEDNPKDDYDDDDEYIDDDIYGIVDMYADVLKGYASYIEDEEDAVSLEDFEENFLTLNIKNPSKVAEETFPNLKPQSFKSGGGYSMHNAPEYSITPVSKTNYQTRGAFSAGTLFDQCIEYGELEQSSGVFSRYDSKYFAIHTAYKKTINSTNNNYNDNFYFSPELKLNQYFTLKEILSTDISQNTKKTEFVLSINPLGKRDIDRLKFEFGASQTFNNTNAVIKNQFKFSTNFKL